MMFKRLISQLDICILICTYLERTYSFHDVFAGGSCWESRVKKMTKTTPLLILCSENYLSVISDEINILRITTTYMYICSSCTAQAVSRPKTGFSGFLVI